MVQKIRKFFAMPWPAMLKQIFGFLPLSCLAWLYIVEIDDPGKKKLRSRFDGQLSWATPAELPILDEIQDKHRIFEERFRHGDLCLLVRDKEGKPLAYEWFCDGRRYHESKYDFDIDIPQDALYAYDAFVKPEARMMGIWYEIRHYMGDWMKEHEKKRLISFVEFGNWNSLNVHLRYGFTLKERMRVFKLLGMKKITHEQIKHSPELVRALLNEHKLI